MAATFPIICLRLSIRNCSRVLFHQPFVFLERGPFLVAVNGGRGRPGQLLAGHRLDERHEPAPIIEHGRAKVDEGIKTLWPREHPAHAMRAEIVARRAVKAADDRLSFRNRERVARDRRAQGEGARAHSLAAGAMAGHREQRRRADPDPYLTAAASALER